MFRPLQTTRTRFIRTRNPEDANFGGVDVTEAGDALFRRLMRAVVVLDARLRSGLTDLQISTLSRTLNRL